MALKIWNFKPVFDKEVKVVLDIFILLKTYKNMMNRTVDTRGLGMSCFSSFWQYEIKNIFPYLNICMFPIKHEFQAKSVFKTVFLQTCCKLGCQNATLLNKESVIFCISNRVSQISKRICDRLIYFSLLRHTVGLLDINEC